jgi:hypothetical protein
MNRAIRDYLKRRVRLCFATAIGGWLLIALGGALARHLPESIPPGSGAKINFCPYCGVNLGEPLPRAQQSAPSQDPIR